MAGRRPALMNGTGDGPLLETRPATALRWSVFTVGDNLEGNERRPGRLREILDYVDSDRSEERRVGKECLTQCRSRWSPYH